MIRHVRQIVAVMAAAAWLATLAGCAPRDRAADATSRSGDRASTSAIDPCAGNLHDLSGALLIYIDQHGRFPPTLQTLESGLGGAELSLSCPVSGRRYVYN